MMKLLPTTTARDHKGSAVGFLERRDGGPDLEGAIVKLLPTPAASDGSGGAAHPDTRKGHTSQIIDAVLLWDSERWAEYLPAINMWEAFSDRPAPAPVEMNKNGNPRLNVKFSEWMMGWPKGWVTDLITTNRKLYAEGMISRTSAMKMVGNGVVPQQAILAIETLMEEW